MIDDGVAEQVRRAPGWYPFALEGMTRCAHRGGGMSEPTTARTALKLQYLPCAALPEGGVIDVRAGSTKSWTARSHRPNSIAELPHAAKAISDLSTCEVESPRTWRTASTARLSP